MINLYHKRLTLRWVVLGVATLISIGSILYTNFIVDQLREREKVYIDLYANTLEYTINETTSQNLTFIFQKIIISNQTIPVILTNELGQPIQSKNIRISERATKEQRKSILARELEVMKEEHEPLIIEQRDGSGKIYNVNYVYYKNSLLLGQLRFYPYVQLSVIAVFGVLVYLAFSYSKTAEQNRVWVGLAKETAHQLATPLSSLIAWLEYIRNDPDLQKKDIISELDKDIKRLETITARFSNIGSVPILRLENIYDTILGTVQYVQKRVSTKVKFEINALPIDIKAQINKPLFDWVIENLVKNAVDAMSGAGKIGVHIKRGKYGDVLIDVQDTGKGIPKSKLAEVFQPGMTSKKRGWGLGLTLAKRIIENYHQGKIFVKHSEVDAGTTFRIILKN